VNVNGQGLTGDAARGKALFLDAGKRCITCHAMNGTDAQGNIGPNLTYFGSRLTIGAGLMENTPENLAKWLYDSTALKSGNLMGRVIKAGDLSDQEIADLVAYLEGMKVSVNLPAPR
jgi:cytochrome c oxidase subunit 2